MNKLFKIVLTVALVMTFVEFARAEETPGASTASASKGNGPCKADVEKFCAGVEKGKGAVMKCLREHDAELSTECKAKRAERKQRWEAKKAACAADKEKFCKDVEKSGGKIRECMKQHEAELSQGCKDVSVRNKSK